MFLLSGIYLKCERKARWKRTRGNNVILLYLCVILMWQDQTRAANIWVLQHKGNQCYDSIFTNKIQHQFYSSFVKRYFLTTQLYIVTFNEMIFELMKKTKLVILNINCLFSSYKPSFVLNRLTSTSFILRITSPASTWKKVEFYNNQDSPVELFIRTK